MKILKFKCELLNDIVLSVSAATEGEQATLDFIPGNNFLGIVARDYNSFSEKEQLEIFHSGKVRFGDAHPAFKTKDGTLKRTLHIPASLFYPKMKQISEECYAFQGYSRQADIKENGTPMQLKQCRTGFYAFNADKTAFDVNIEKTFSIKSAYDRDQRRAKDSDMYGYQSIDKGQTFLFDVEVDNDELADAIKSKLTGIQHVGRSRTSQYGLVDIQEADYETVLSHEEPLKTKNGKRIAVYADSRLIFLDKYGQPILTPDAENFGINGKIDWGLSQVRTFQYAPWNGARRTRDCDRCGIEKGSVFFIETNESVPKPKYVGSYNNEGFGHVIYNPDFLDYTGGNGKATFKFVKSVKKNKVDADRHKLEGTPLLSYLHAQKTKHDVEEQIVEYVNKFVDENEKRFRGEKFASQWGRIRKIAMSNPSKKDILYELFDKQKDVVRKASPSRPYGKKEKEDDAYLTHGVAAKKWKTFNRVKALKDFINVISDEDYVQQAVVNLASEMAKICKQNGK